MEEHFEKIRFNEIWPVSKDPSYQGYHLRFCLTGNFQIYSFNLEYFITWRGGGGGNLCIIQDENVPFYSTFLEEPLDLWVPLCASSRFSGKIFRMEFFLCVAISGFPDVVFLI